MPVLARIGRDANAVVNHFEKDRIVRSSRERHADMACSRVLFNIDERLSQNMNKVDLFIGRKLQAEERVRNGRCDARGMRVRKMDLINRPC